MDEDYQSGFQNMRVEEFENVRVPGRFPLQAKKRKEKI
jgi:hypothetical protein